MRENNSQQRERGLEGGEQLSVWISTGNSLFLMVLVGQSRQSCAAKKRWIPEGWAIGTEGCSRAREGLMQKKGGERHKRGPERDGNEQQ